MSVRAFGLLILLMLSPVVSHATESQFKHFYLSVGSPDGDLEWGKRECAFLHNAILVEGKAPVVSVCGQINNVAELDKHKLSGKFQYHIRVEKESDGTVGFTVQNWTQGRDNTDFNELSWTIEPLPDGDQKLYQQKLIAKFLKFERSQRLVKETVLTKGAASSEVIRVAADGNYQMRSTGKKIDFEQAYRVFQYEKPVNSHLLRASIELVGVLGLGLLQYHQNISANQRDWDLQYDWPSFRKKLTFEAVSFDTNRYDTNALTHTVGGSFYYLAARSNQRNILESFMFAFVGSALWEYLGEFREHVSINDMIVTPVTGMVVGEALTQLGAFFDRGGDNFVNNVLGSIFGAPKKLHDWIDKNRPKRSANLDRLGFSKDLWHRFKIFGGVGFTSQKNSLGALPQSFNDLSFGLSTEIINIPTYGHEGQVSKFVVDGNFSRLIVEATNSKDALTDFVLVTKTAFAGYYHQEVGRPKNGELSGYSFFIGFGSGWDYTLHNYDRAHSKTLNQMAIVNVLGTTMDLNVVVHGVRIRVTLDVFGDFAMVRSFALDKYSAVGGAANRLPSVAQGERYYYAFGVTIEPKAQIQYKNWEIGGQVKLDNLTGTHFKDRSQSQLVNEVSMGDMRSNFKAWAAYTLPGDWLQIMFSMQRRIRSGYVDQYSNRLDETTFMAGLVILF